MIGDVWLEKNEEEGMDGVLDGRSIFLTRWSWMMMLKSGMRRTNSQWGRRWMAADIQNMCLMRPALLAAVIAASW